ncbi:MAG: NUDIX hydrolase [Desulfobacterales bacterium]
MGNEIPEAAETGPSHPRPAVGAVVFKDSCVLLVRRGKAPALGQWAIPGGRIELGETLGQAAEREIREETGIIIRAKAPIYAFDAIERDDQGDVRFHYVIVDLAADFVGGDLLCGDDALEARWVSAGEFGQLRVNSATRHLLHSRFDFPERTLSNSGLEP